MFGAVRYHGPFRDQDSHVTGLMNPEVPKVSELTVHLTLVLDEKAGLKSCESVIERGLKTLHRGRKRSPGNSG